MRSLDFFNQQCAYCGNAHAWMIDHFQPLMYGGGSENTPEKLGKFHFDEFEIHAEINADGTIAVLGTGVHAGIAGGLRFVFKRGTDATEQSSHH